jgi:carbamoyltransferase
MRERVTFLGINDGHDAGAALLRDGRILAAVQEERLRNLKNYSGVPTRAIREVFRVSGVPPEEVSGIAVASLNRVYAPRKENPFRLRLFEALSPYVHSPTFSRFYVKVLHRFRPMKELHHLFTELGIAEKELFFVEHHVAHAAAAYYVRPWEGEALVLTLDGAGDGWSATVSVGDGGSLERIAASTYYDSLGNAFYSEVTAHLGLKRWEHEYKLMGLAPYGDPERCLEKMRRLIRLHPRRPLEFQNTSGACNTRVSGILQRLLRGERFHDIAAAAQRHFEDLLQGWVAHAIEATGIPRIACSGGCFLNVKANRRIREMEGVEEVFFFPVADDGGTPVGAALEAYHRYCRREGIRPSCPPLEDLYLGREYADEEIRSLLERTGWLEKAEYLPDIEGEITRLLLEGGVVARFQGREEFGPRALGNRSLLADPRDLRVVRKLNQKIKQRDFWMPFAPSLLEERAGEYLLHPKPARYMVEAFGTTERAEEAIPAGLHPQDLSARPQTVNDWNSRFRRVLEAFESETGVSGLLNTSFNLHGSPIVGSPETALHTFIHSGIDALAIGNYWIQR